MVRSRSTSGVALLALLASAPLGSCVADSVSLRNTCALVPDTDCTFSTGSECYIRGMLNLEAATTYTSVLQVTNGLKAREREVPPLSETNGIQIDQVEVEVKDSAGNNLALAGLPNPFTVPASGAIPPGDEGIVGADLLPAAYVTALRALSRLNTINLSVIARGKTSGDVEVETAKWPWYINLIRKSADPAQNQCVIIEDSVCGLGQDKFANVCDPTMVEID